MISQLVAYGISVGSAMVANFVLMLFLVRLLSPESYAAIVLVKVSFLMVTSLAAMGLSQAAVRWLGTSQPSDRVAGTVMGGVLSFAVPASIAFAATLLIVEGRISATIDAQVLLLSAIVVPAFMLNSELLNWQRALKRPKAHAVISTGRAIVQLVGVSGAVYLVRDIKGFFGGMAAAEVILLAALFIFARPNMSFRSDLLKQMVVYGWPHTLVISSGFLLTYVDRYMLAFMAAETRVVAFYDGAYMVVGSVLALLVRPFNLYLFPSYMSAYAKQGEGAAVQVIERVQRFLLISGFLLSAIVVLFREPLLILLLPDGYQVAASIFMPVALGVLLNGVFMGTVGGLYISEKTVAVGMAAVVALVTNVVANWLLIPVYGMDGAALSTAIAYLAQLLVGYHFARKILPVKLPLGLLAAGGAGLALISWITE